MALSRAGMASQRLFRNFFRNSAQAFSSKAVQPMSPMWVPDRPTEAMMKDSFSMDLSSQVGYCMPLSMMRIGTLIHHIELRPGQGPKLVRSAGTVAKILTEPSSTSSIRCEVKLPSGEKKLIDKRCRAIIGQMSKQRGKKKLRKAGQSRWLGIRPKVRGVAKNPVDHPHGGGEGKSKSSGSHGKGSRTPWGKPTKCGYKTRSPKKKNII